MTAIPNKLIEVHYLETKHGYFPELVRLLAALSSIGLSLKIHKGHSVKPYGSSDYLALTGKDSVSGLDISYFVGPIYQQLLSPTKRMPKVLNLRKLFCGNSWS